MQICKKKKQTVKGVGDRVRTCIIHCMYVHMSTDCVDKVNISLISWTHAIKTKFKS